MQAPEAKYEGSIAAGMPLWVAGMALGVAFFVIGDGLPRSTTPTKSTMTAAPRTGAIRNAV
jgi:hypothetical protein